MHGVNHNSLLQRKKQSATRCALGGDLSKQRKRFAQPCFWQRRWCCCDLSHCRPCSVVQALTLHVQWRYTHVPWHQHVYLFDLLCLIFDHNWNCLLIIVRLGITPIFERHQNHNHPTAHNVPCNSQHCSIHQFSINNHSYWDSTFSNTTCIIQQQHSYHQNTVHQEKRKDDPKEDRGQITKTHNQAKEASRISPIPQHQIRLPSLPPKKYAAFQ